MSAPFTQALARFAALAPPDALPQTLHHEGKRALLNWAGCAVGGAREPAVEHAAAALLPLAGPPRATLLGRGRRCDEVNAAFINGLASSLLDFDDTHIPTAMHPTVTVAPAALACAESRGRSGRELLEALLIGIEVGCRVGRALGRAHYERGWHITASAGVFGAAAACGRLLGLDETRMTWALGIAATQAGGIMESLGTMSRGGHAGFAGRNGLTAALLAKAGFTGPVKGLEGRFGFAHLASPQPDFTAALAGLGQTWELAQVGYKPYPSGLVTHPLIDACLNLKRQGLAVDDIAGVEVVASTLAITRCDRPEPVRGLEARLSFQHCAAVALSRGRASVGEFTDDCVHDPAIAALRAKVKTRADDTVAINAGTVRVTLAGGRVLSTDVPYSQGSPQQPLSDADLERKVTSLCEWGIVPQAAPRLIEAIWSLDRATDVAALTQALD